MSKRILLLGCGQLGSRHLQALAVLDNVETIIVVDPNANGLALGQQRLKEVPNANTRINYHWHQEIPAGITVDLVVVATLAINRYEHIKTMLERVKVTNLLIEKIVTQSVETYAALSQLLKKHKVNAWVNCKSRAYTIHQQVKAMIKPHEPLVMTVIAGNQGLATNGLHEIDLFFHYCPLSELSVAVSQLDPIAHPSKRGNGIVDLSGLIVANDKSGNSLSINFINDNQMPDTIFINTTSHRFIIDHFRKLFMVSTVERDWIWQTIGVDEPWQVSAMSTGFVNDILTKGSCLLPSLAQHQPAHDFLMSVIKPHLIKLGISCEQGCPVT